VQRTTNTFFIYISVHPSFCVFFSSLKKIKKYRPADGVCRVDPFDKNSPIKTMSIEHFPPNVVFVLRVFQLLRGLQSAMGVLAAFFLLVSYIYIFLIYLKNTIFYSILKNSLSFFFFWLVLSYFPPAAYERVRVAAAQPAGRHAGTFLLCPLCLIRLRKFWKL
jgi:hypothetical protein